MNSMKKVLITGITGQDGSYMAEYCLNLGLQVFGMVRRTAQIHDENFRHIRNHPNLKIVRGDLLDGVSINNLVQEIQPDYFINFAAQSFVGDSWDIPEETFMSTAVGVLKCLEAVRRHAPMCRFYNAGCHTPDTRVMTPDGLKFYHEMKIGDLVYSINPKNNNLEWKQILKIYEYDFAGNLMEFKNGGLLVTPNHTMLYKTSRNNILSRKALDFINLSDVKYPINNPCNGKVLPKKTNLSHYIPTPKKLGNKNYGKHITEINSYDLMYLIGLYIGDGSCRIIKKKKMVGCLFGDRNRDERGQFTSNYSEEKNIEVEYQCPQCVIDIPPTDKCFSKVTELLDRNNIKWKLNGQCDITFHQWGLNPYFCQCGNSASQKTIPRWIFELDASYQLKVLEGIIDSDGDNRNTITTASKQLQMDLLNLHINCGIMPTFGERPPRKSSLKDGRIISGNFPEYHVHGLKENTGYQRGKWKNVPYNGKVWCFEVEDNHNFLVERNGKLTFSGNSSEQFGDVIFSPQTSSHPFRPRSPYGAAKCAAHMLVKVYRESYCLYAIQGLLFNHESERRGEEFVTRKITKGFARIVKAIKANKPFEPICLGNIDAKRDWSHARDFVDAIWRMLNQDEFNPKIKKELDTSNASLDAKKYILINLLKEYTVASGEARTVREFINVITDYLGYPTEWSGNGLNEKLSINEEFAKTIGSPSNLLVSIDSKFYRPADVNTLLGDNSEIKEDLGWKQMISFDSLVKRMLKCDLYESGIVSIPTDYRKED
jgi:GDP-D-mannose dehydratase